MMTILTIALAMLAVGAVSGATIWGIVQLIKKIMGFKD